MNSLFYLNKNLATSYLPRKWPSKYFHRNESLRPCSGWERVFSSRLVTKNVFLTVPITQNQCHTLVRWKLHNDYKLHVILNIASLLAPVEFSYKNSYVAIVMLPCLSCPTASQHRQHRLRFLGKALVLLVSVDWKCCHSYISDLSTLWSATGLTSLCYERSHLVVGFVLICFQHLSTWNTATGRLLLAE